jgi:hypothetical protein
MVAARERRQRWYVRFDSCKTIQKNHIRPLGIARVAGRTNSLPAPLYCNGIGAKKAPAPMVGGDRAPAAVPERGTLQAARTGSGAIISNHLDTVIDLDQRRPPTGSAMKCITSPAFFRASRVISCPASGQPRPFAGRIAEKPPRRAAQGRFGKVPQRWAPSHEGQQRYCGGFVMIDCCCINQVPPCRTQTTLQEPCTSKVVGGGWGLGKVPDQLP